MNEITKLQSTETEVKEQEWREQNAHTVDLSISIMTTSCFSSDETAGVE